MTNLIKHPGIDRAIDKTIEQINDEVNHPAHYLHGGMETIDLIKHVTGAYPKEVVYQIGNAVKYLDRAPYKGHLKQDIEKAIWYLNDAVKTLEEAETHG